MRTSLIQRGPGGELLSLEVSDVDFLRRTIRVRDQRSQSGDLMSPKSKASRRTVPGDVPSEGALFLDEFGEAVGYRRWKRLFGPAAFASDVDVTAHGFRHFFASALIAGGASVKQVQTVLGHASAVVTLRTYAHLWPGDEDRVRDVADAALSPLAD